MTDDRAIANGWLPSATSHHSLFLRVHVDFPAAAHMLRRRANDKNTARDPDMAIAEDYIELRAEQREGNIST